MAKLKDKILNALKRDDELENTLNLLSKSQENLLKNYSNPAVKDKDRDNILQNYSNLQNIGQALYRFNTLKSQNYLADAREEKKNIENVLLKGGVSYNKYIWHSENGENTCDECKALDGEEFGFYDEVPPRPHPNCRCWVDIIKGKVETDNDEPQENENKNLPHTQTHQPSVPQPTPQPEKSFQSQKWIMPCQGRISSEYGKRKPPVPGASTWHNGWDIEVPIGTPVKAIADGKVIATGAAKGYGYWVAIDHGIINGVQVTSEYGHISSWNVRYGQIIKQGDIIAKSGNTGYSSGPHLHITIREGRFQGTAVDPSKYVRTNF